MNTEIHVPPQTELPNPTIDISQLTLDQAEQFRKVEIQYNTSDDKLINIDRLTASARRELDKILEDEMSTLQDLAFQDKFDIVLEKYQTLIDTEKNTLQEKQQITRQHKRNASRRKTIDEIQKIELVEPFLDQEFVSETKIKMYKTIIGKAKYQHKLEELAQLEGITVDQLKKTSASEVSHRLKIAREKAQENTTAALEYLAETPVEPTGDELLEEACREISEGIKDIAQKLGLPANDVAEIVAQTSEALQELVPGTSKVRHILKNLRSRPARVAAAVLMGISLNLSPSPIAPLDAHAPVNILIPRENLDKDTNLVHLSSLISTNIQQQTDNTIQLAQETINNAQIANIQDKIQTAIKRSEQHVQEQILLQQKDHLEKTVFQVQGSNRGFVLAGEQGNFAGDYIERTDQLQFDDETIKDLYEIQQLFTEKRQEFGNHMAVQFSPEDTIQFSIANADEKVDGSITDEFEVNPNQPVHFEISGIEIDSTGEYVNLKLDNTYTGDGKIHEGQESGVIFIKAHKDAAKKLLANSHKGFSTAFFADAQPYYVTNVTTGLEQIDQNTQYMKDQFSLIDLTDIDKPITDLYEKGYIDGYMIQGKTIAKAVAGGVCGGGTLAFNTAIRALEGNQISYKILHQQNHSQGGGYTPGFNEPSSSLPIDKWRDTTIAYNNPNNFVDGKIEFEGKLHLNAGILYKQDYKDKNENVRTKALFFVNAKTNPQK